MDSNSDPRLQELRVWVSGIDGLASAELTPASDDASFRRYFRVNDGDTTFIVMDAPPPVEDCSRFMRIASWLRKMSLNCPRVLHADIGRGFLLISDLGDCRYLDELTRNPASAPALYIDAFAALHTLQLGGRSWQEKLPPYDEKLLRFELSIFREWLCERHLGIRFTGREEKFWESCCDFLVHAALDQPRVFVHRDYHSRNLMFVPDNNPGILDFQDALAGPLTYDVVSLLRDCYIRMPEMQVRQRALQYFDDTERELSGGMTADEFMRCFDLMGAQRHLKAAGIFARLRQRDGKKGYMKDVPRTLRYVQEVADNYAELDFVRTLIGERVLPSLESSQ